MKNIKSLSLLVLGASAVASINTASADIQHLDDVIITFSQCVGNDCVNGENFGFDTQRLKENNLRIHFDDTSNSASFPSNDWRIVINDTSNGGASYFAVEDSTAGRTPFRVDAGAPNDALRVNNAGNIGIGVANPVVELHVKDGDTPTMRLEQDGSSGFTPQTYDIAANESNFFIRDVTNGSSLFFRAQPGAPADSMFISSSGDVGFGTSAPTDDLHIRDTGPARLALENTSATENAGLVGGTHQKWTMNSNGLFRITGGTDSPEFIMDSEGNVTILGSITTMGGVCGSGCDAVFEPNHELPSIEEHAQLMWERKHLPNVGPTIENQPINVSDKIGRMLNELETAHIYIEDLHRRIAKLEEALESN